MSDSYLIDSDLMSLQARSCSGDASKMLDAKGQSHDLYAKARPIAMHCRIVLAGRRRSRYDRWRDQRIKVSAPRLQKRTAALMTYSTGKRLSICSTMASTITSKTHFLKMN